jgi:hypothetical protein
MRNRFVRRLSLSLILLLSPSVARAQGSGDSASTASSAGQSTSDTASPGVDATPQVLACARDEGLSAGFQAQLNALGTVMHLWKPHLQSMDTNEMDYVRVRVYGRGTAKGLRWDVDAYTLTGRAFITTSVYSPRPPSRDAGALRRRIQQACKPAES